MNKITTTVPLEQLCEPDRGITYGIVKVGDFIPGGVPVIRGGDIRDGRIVFDDSKRVTEEVSNKFRRTILRGGELLINLIAEPGHVAIVPKHLAGSNVSRDVAVIPLNDSVDHRFVCYFLKSPDCVQWLTSRLQGSVTQKINLNTLREVPVPLPPLPEQKAIAHILGTLDDKIELNREMNRTLEAMARAIFKSWFVDFDPVRAKMEGRQPAGMDAATAELFPSEFEESALGMIPKGWEVKSLDEIAHFLNGLALQKYPPTDDNYLPVIKIAELRKGVTDSSGKASPYIDSKYIIQDGDVIFSWSGSLEVCVWHGGKGALNQHLFKVTSAQYPKWFYYQWIKYHLPQFQEIAASKATTMGHIQRHHLNEAKVVVPTKDTINLIDKSMEPLLNLSISNNLESRTLASLRDTLLPKLLSGEIRVKEAEKVVAKVL